MGMLNKFRLLHVATCAGSTSFLEALRRVATQLATKKAHEVVLCGDPQVTMGFNTKYR